MTDDNSTEPALVQRGPWLTVPDLKSVLVVAHTLVYAQRLREVVSLVESDLRVQVFFTVAPHAFGDGVNRYLEDQGISVLPWEHAVRTTFDLAIAAGSRGIHRLRAPVIRMPHGGGNIKVLRASEGMTAETAGVPSSLTRRYLTHEGRVVPAVLALSHQRDLQILERSCPEALPVARVVGDPCYDRVLASVPHRARYRAALGLTEAERLLFVSFTWGPTSSFGGLDALLPRLLGELPPDVRIALTAHPNIYAAHSRWQVRRWLGPALGNRIHLVPPEVGWQGPLLAADWTIGDSGSVTMYGTLTGRPILLARHTTQEVAPDSVAARLAATAPAVSPHRPLREQLAYAEETHRPAEHRRIARQLSSRPGAFHRLMRGLLYRSLGLAEPAHPTEVRLVPPPTPMHSWYASETEAAA
ncbi:hypothetical protein RM844_17200 [Streptomyces sp. DSM 44915]|uniref:Uncharacterized protein n=1 Tax=Streptomyces chisholmiae TaxID=3075540 RepID=A0ABU2JSP9_9ACTN|nr:hypothetical protein [Streptomyces sp. DSM 44915]MDT0268020.1 hypothetical protein [Streptomyces sp. DSM 44915]